MQLSTFLFPLLVFFSCSSCGTDITTGEATVISPESPTSGEDTPTTTPNLSAAAISLNTEALQMVNQQRQQGCRCGNQNMPPVPPLSRNNVLVITADEHAKDMEQMNRMQHTGSDGSDSGTRLTRNGYRWRAVGENIARGQTSISQVVNGWFDSPGHCRNLMSANFTEFGMARSGLYWAQVFAAPF